MISRLRDEFAFHHSRGELTRQTVREEFQFADWHRFDALKLKITLGHNFFETPQRQLVESASYFFEMVSRSTGIFAVPPQ